MHFEKREVNARAVTINHQVERIANTVIRAYDVVKAKVGLRGRAAAYDDLAYEFVGGARDALRKKHYDKSLRLLWKAEQVAPWSSFHDATDAERALFGMAERGMTSDEKKLRAQITSAEFRAMLDREYTPTQKRALVTILSAIGHGEAYAWLVIVGELMHYVRDYEFGIRIPRALLELEREVAAAQDALAVRLEREPTTAEIADVLGVSAMAVARARRIRSVARPLAVDEVNTLALASGDGLGAEDRFALTQAFRKLGALERRVVGGMYLLGLTQAQIASALEISPKRVSRVHLRALANMRQGWTA